MLKSLLLLIAISNPCFSSQVLIVTQTQKAFLASIDPTKTWKVGDALCAKSSTEIGGCGKIAKITPKGYMVSVTYKRGEITKGMDVLQTKRLPASSGTATASTTTSGSTYKRSRDSDSKTIGISLGSQFSTSYLIPYLHLDYKIAKQLSVGIQPSYFSGASSTLVTFSAIGLGIGGTFYSKENMQGIFGNLSLVPTMYSISSGTTSESGTKIGGTLSGGYALKLGKMFALTGALGAQYLPLPDTLNLIFDYSAILPYAYLSFGVLL